MFNVSNAVEILLTYQRVLNQNAVALFRQWQTLTVYVQLYNNTLQFNSAKTILAFLRPPQLRHEAKRLSLRFSADAINEKVIWSINVRK